VQQAAARSSDEIAIRDTAAAWSEAAGAKDLDGCLSFYSDDASVLPFNAPICTDKAQIRQLWSQLMSNPDYSLRFGPVKVEVARSGELAYEIGTFDLTLRDETGQKKASRGKYVVVWKKRGENEWKASVDIFNTDR
jgi:ketosteroid isomerase-like protein